MKNLRKTLWFECKECGEETVMHPEDTSLGACNECGERRYAIL